MLLNLTDLSSEPLQRQIIRQIRARILANELSAGTGLPSIRNLARSQHISVITVKRAYESLEREKLIHSRRGKGFYVSKLLQERKKTMANQRLMENLKPIISAALAEGLAASDISEVVAIILKKVNGNSKQSGA